MFRLTIGYRAMLGGRDRCDENLSGCLSVILFSHCSDDPVLAFRRLRTGCGQSLKWALRGGVFDVVIEEWDVGDGIGVGTSVWRGMRSPGFVGWREIKKGPACAGPFLFLNGAADETRTRDSLLGRQRLYQLSYHRSVSSTLVQTHGYCTSSPSWSVGRKFGFKGLILGPVDALPGKK